MQASHIYAQGYAVVLSAYNGAVYLQEQVESIRAQTAKQWRLYVRDDGSGDDTYSLLVEHAALEPRIRVLPRDGRNLGPAASFGVLLQHAVDCGERYVFLSDQDDVWLPEKCQRMLALMHRREAAVGPEAPLLAHSDLQVVGPDLSPIHPSLVGLQHIDANEELRDLRLLLGNSVTGCATLVNVPLLRCALPIPQVAMHDWWLGQCAAAFGEVLFLDEPTVLYRQHGRNVVGARGLLARALTIFRSPREWWVDSAKRFLAGLRQVWVIRSRASSRDIPMVQRVRQSVDALWRGLGEGQGTLSSRLAAAGRSGAMPRAVVMRGLFLTRVMLLPLLRARLGDEREGVREPGEGART